MTASNGDNVSFFKGVKIWLGITAQTPDSPKAPLGTSTRLAYERTILAHERTLMAWIRTSASMISFGFTIYKFFQLEEGMGGKFATQQVLGPRQFAMIMITTGILALTVATVQHRRELVVIKRACGHVSASTAGWVAGMVSVLGLGAMIAVIFRL